MSETGFRRAGERQLSLDSAEQDMRQYVGKHGVEKALLHAIGIANTLGIDLAALGVIPIVNGHDTNGSGVNGIEAEPAPAIEQRPVKAKRRRSSAKEPEAPPAAPPPAPVYFNRKGDQITEARHKGGLTAWDTRRALDAMQAANPRLSRMAALALYRDEHPRSRAKNLTGPRREASKGETSWDTRIKNIIKKHYARTGETLSWQDAHQRALDSLQGSRQAALPQGTRRAA